MDSELSRYLTVAQDLARVASARIASSLATNPAVSLKSDGSVVTQVDLEINQMVLDTIDREFPDHDVIGEEGSSRKGRSNRAWICDPIDGTLPFTIGLPLSTFALALVEDGVPIVGVIAYPFRDMTACAVKGEGATINGEPIHVGTRTSLETAVIDQGTSHRWGHYIPNLGDAIDEAGAVSAMIGSSALAALLIASGRIDGTICSTPTVWDAAPHKLIIEEAGGVYTNLNGDDQRYDAPVYGMVAGNAHLHPLLLDIVKRQGVLSS